MNMIRCEQKYRATIVTYNTVPADNSKDSGSLTNIWFKATGSDTYSCSSYCTMSSYPFVNCIILKVVSLQVIHTPCILLHILLLFCDGNSSHPDQRVDQHYLKKKKIKHAFKFLYAHINRPLSTKSTHHCPKSCSAAPVYCQDVT